MVNTEQLIAKDLRHIWHPCMQMKDFEQFPPIVVERAQGNILYTNHGPLIDGISSWWCKSLGHGHPAVLAAIRTQMDLFEHVIGANTTHPALAELGEQLCSITGKQHSFFASDGASAVEIAMKLVIHGMLIKGYKNKNQFIALKNGYHGETLGTMSVSDLGIYKAPYDGFGVSCHFVTPPYVRDNTASLWTNCDSYWASILPELEKIKERVCAIILEPIVQGAGGMLCYSADFLKKLAHWAKANDIYLITDEIMTGLGRTGRWLAAEHAGVDPDIICLSKGLTSGSIPFSCIMIDHKVFDLFYADYSEGKSFLHSHTYSGNPLAVSAALATIKVMQDESIIPYAEQLGKIMLASLHEVAKLSGKLENVRGIGPIVAADLINPHNKRIGNDLYQKALELGALIRPMGNTLYWLPPLNTEAKIIEQLAEITLNSINLIYK
ncbi:adenosylmethionine--8-amino-7-oxononanoate transaminase [Legionella sp. km772]|uniref:adenosylmethionine--8-amino-7-oxononanoate transaminase n=1 Tax=Legionella sp. km772 TaxID=2498111 RepID=UPI000F8E2F7B|nr:adenosylmethionine--8-amino-7-oxononanoate transaminase [Legionella sp. km772]RUR12947.1 adenosylmethionine--8-amino-7-oxononanoate transaminase [Legionella sp. km772]